MQFSDENYSKIVFKLKREEESIILKKNGIILVDIPMLKVNLFSIIKRINRTNFLKMKLTDEYIFRQPEMYQSILLHIISVVTKSLPDAELLLKYGVPYFYYKKKAFCYLVNDQRKGFVDLGFARGFKLKRNQEFLVDESRNTVKSLRYFSLEAVDNAILEAVIKEAATLYI